MGQSRPFVTLFTLLDRCRHGRFLVPTHDAYVGRSLQHYGEYAEAELQLLYRYCDATSRVVAVGGNIGALVVPLAQRVAEVITLEPQRWIFQLLCANVALNNLTNVRPYWAAGGHAVGWITVPVLDPACCNNFGALDLSQTITYVGDMVAVQTVDSMAGIGMDLLTLDVEGMELDILEGGERTIQQYRPVIWAECNRPANRPSLLAWFDRHGYDVTCYQTPWFSPANYAGDPVDYFDGLMDDSVLAIPCQ